MVNYNDKEKSGVSVQALRNLWDKKNDHSDPINNQRIHQQIDPLTGQPPALPPKSKSRKLTGTVSVDAMSLSQVRRKVELTDYHFLEIRSTQCRWIIVLHIKTLRVLHLFIKMFD